MRGQPACGCSGRAGIAESSSEEADEPWRESLPEAVASDNDDDTHERRKHDPLKMRASDRLMAFFKLADGAAKRSPNLDTLMRNAMEVTGGLAQVSSLPAPCDMDDCQAGLGLVQLKRALRGAAFVRGSLFLLRSEGIVTDDEFHGFMEETVGISAQITDRLRAIREAQAPQLVCFDSSAMCW